MDAKITKKRLGHQLSYDWIKIAGTCILAVVLLLVLFTTIATRPTAGQTFDFYTFFDVRFNSSRLGSLDTLKEKGALSYDIQKLNTYEVTSTGYEDMILSTRFAAGEGDVIIASDVGDVVAEDGSGALTDLSGLKEFLYGYRGNCMWLGTDGQPYTTDPTYSGMEFSNYFADCAAYLDKFFPGADYQSTVKAGQAFDEAEALAVGLDETAAENEFNERMQGDKRFKTVEQKAQGIADEKTRLLNLRDAFVKVWNSVQTDGAIRVNTLNFSADVNGDGSVAADGSETFSWSYSFDISGLEDITDVLVTYTTSGSGTVTGSREGLSMCVVRNGTSSEEELRYEPFTMLAYFVEEFNGGDWTTYHTGGETDA